MELVFKMRYCTQSVFALLLVFAIFSLTFCQHNSTREFQDNDIGPMMGPPGNVIRCDCNYTEFENEFLSLHGTYTSFKWFDLTV